MLPIYPAGTQENPADFDEILLNPTGGSGKPSSAQNYPALQYDRDCHADFRS